LPRSATSPDGHRRKRSRATATQSTHTPTALKKALWTKSGRAKLESLQLAPWAAQRRQDFLELLDQLTPKIEQLSIAIEEESLECDGRLRGLLHQQEAEQRTAFDVDWKRRYIHLSMRREKRIAKIAMARRLGVRMYWMRQCFMRHSAEIMPASA
jgi:hypothetical protein